MGSGRREPATTISGAVAADSRDPSRTVAGPRRRSLRYLGSRLVTALLVVIGAIALLFSLTLIVPGNPADTLLGPEASPEYREAFIRQMGLDLPVHERLALFFANVLQGDLGMDAITGRPVLAVVLEVLPFTLTLAFCVIALSILVAVPLGCYAATHHGTWIDQALAVASVSVIAIPDFVIAIFLLLVFSIWLDWLPVIGAGAPGDFWDQVSRLVLPTAVLALGWIGYLARIMRASLLEVLGEAYIRTSRAYGLSERLVVYKYALKNACIPTIAILGLGIGRLLGGAVFVEIIFARPGLGKLIYDAIGTRNYPMVQGAVLVVVLLFVLANLLVDLSYAWLDPRMRRQEEGERR